MATTSPSLSAAYLLCPVPLRPRLLFRALAVSGLLAGDSKSKGKGKSLEPPPNVVLRGAPAWSTLVFEQHRTKAGFNPGGGGKGSLDEEVRQ